MFRAGAALRVIGWALFCICTVLFVLAATIHINQYLLRRRAEQLLGDLRSLELRKSTYGDVRRIISRWGKDVYQTGPCQPYRCSIQITLQNLGSENWRFWSEHQRILAIYARLGGRPAVVTASFGVRNGIVWEKGFEVWVEKEWSVDHDTGTYWSTTLIARARTASPHFISSQHPEYHVGWPSGCTFCEAIYSDFTPFAAPADINRLMGVNLSCLTRSTPCQTRADIYPAAWQQAQSDRLVPEGERENCNQEVIRTLGREAWQVRIGTVTKPGKSRRDVVVRWEADLKSRDSHFLRERTIFADSTPEEAKRGERYIAFYEHPDIPTFPCGVVPATPENMKAVTQGTSEDWSDYSQEAAFPFLYQQPGIKPPIIDIKEQ